jgi:UDP-N-acetylmuramate: L-alanyl-gamma-D-glutamyl-meso-diaminopimelate ligase
MRLHILGICGTFMAGLASLARELGHEVTGSDANVYPPMSDFLATLGIDPGSGWDPARLDPAPDVIVVGNALSRGNPMIEHVLNAGLPYTSGPAWLAEHVLRNRHVVAVAGTHGKTTTSSLVAWLLEANGLSPGFLIGGIPENFGVPARLGHGGLFVVEADEYDTAFFDKRSKFLHYRPRTLLLNNLEFDHADIFPDLAAIKTQFHHLLRTVPGHGDILWNGDDPAIADVLSRGCWSRRVSFGVGSGADWRLHERTTPSLSREIVGPATGALPLVTPLAGRHNALNAVAALATAAVCGVEPGAALDALSAFRNVKRRLQVLGTARGVTVYDDFAHHPTAITATIAALRERVGDARIIALLEPRSNTMRMGAFQHTLADALKGVEHVVMFAPQDLNWDVNSALSALQERIMICESLDKVVDAVCRLATPGTQVLIMSNGAFGGVHARVLTALAREPA